jgi:hypothetical protein
VKRAWLLGLILVVASPLVANAAYRDTGFDPNDIETQDGFRLPDVRSTTRRVASHDDRRVLAVIVRSYGRWPGFHILVRLDARGGPRADVLMLLFNAADQACIVWQQGQRNDAVRGRFGLRDDRTVCRAPTRLLHPDKRVRWKVIAMAPDGGFAPDHAPDDHGWYG